MPWRASAQLIGFGWLQAKRVACKQSRNHKTDLYRLVLRVAAEMTAGSNLTMVRVSESRGNLGAKGYRESIATVTGAMQQKMVT